MMSFATRCLSIVAISLLLAACQSAPQVANLPTDDLVGAFRQLEQSLASGQLDDAESQLDALQRRATGDTRLEQYQRQLAEAYLRQGQQALQSGDLNGAATALSRARSLMPQAPALTTGLDGAIAQARETQQTNAAQARSPADQAAVLKATQPPSADAPAPAQSRAKLIDPAAASSVVPLPMLDTQDNERLRSLLDTVAEDVVAFRCAVRIEVRQAKDFPWVAALLNARIKRLDPSFSARLSQAINPGQVPQLVLTPHR
ncbi:hypothetical protein FBY03_104225 [Pseudomonas sp. SJZ079]|uniref:PA5502 family lipoprotein n=1 Tax=Pseudomonas sp. SJZ079 TaxID=2572887 RepID=UPI00119A4C19|nr:PA5502 family lipoprotein [Pseudomonas sp. SJZ079]TWC39674.1 hypothetical protein FBY03_104225 [Pseudomonas sp. SJZ079]